MQEGSASPGTTGDSRATGTRAHGTQRRTDSPIFSCFSACCHQIVANPVITPPGIYLRTKVLHSPPVTFWLNSPAIKTAAGQPQGPLGSWSLNSAFM